MAGQGSGGKNAASQSRRRGETGACRLCPAGKMEPGHHFPAHLGPDRAGGSELAGAARGKWSRFSCSQNLKGARDAVKADRRPMDRTQRIRRRAGPEFWPDGREGAGRDQQASPGEQPQRRRSSTAGSGFSSSWRVLTPEQRPRENAGAHE